MTSYRKRNPTIFLLLLLTLVIILLGATMLQNYQQDLRSLSITNQSSSTSGGAVAEEETVLIPYGSNLHIYLKLPSPVWKTNSRQLTWDFEDQSYVINFQIEKTDFLKGNYGGQLELVETITTPSDKTLHILKNDAHVYLSSCLPQNGYGCSIQTEDGLLFVIMYVYEEGGHYPKELNFSTSSTQDRVRDFIEMMKTLRIEP